MTNYSEALQAIFDAIVLVKDGSVVRSALSESTIIFPNEDNSHVDIDIDSLDALDMITLVEQRLGSQLPDDVSVLDFRTLGDIARVLSGDVRAPA